MPNVRSEVLAVTCSVCGHASNEHGIGGCSQCPCPRGYDYNGKWEEP